MNKIIIDRALNLLSQSRPIFWSEADFQFAFAEALRQFLPHASIRLERPYTFAQKDICHYDIWIEEDGKVYPIELKYKTSLATCTYNNETFQVKEQSAFDEGRYDCVYDIKRIEDLKNVLQNFGEGYTVILSNSKKYYDVPNSSVTTMDQDFRIHQGEILSGLRKWIKKPNAKKVINGDRGNRKQIILKGSYTIDWNHYSIILDDNQVTHHHFKYCVNVIK